MELGTHVRGAVRNGASEVEIREALLQARYLNPLFYIIERREGIDELDLVLVC